MIWRLIHHVIAHPLMLVLSDKHGNAFHDWTARKGWPEKETP